MFSSARLKLTLWYFLIITVITVIFSMGIYKALTLELDRIERVQRLRVEHLLLPPPPGENFGKIDPTLIKESENRIALAIFLIDLGVIAIATGGGYFLAGRTLAPIEEMVEEQKKFTADASHELRTPLSAMKSEIEVSLRDKNLNLSEAKTLLKSNLEEVDKLKSLSDYLLTLNKYQGSDISMDLEKVSLLQIWEDCQIRINPLARKKRISIKLSLKDSSVLVNGKSLSQLLTILVDNAIKFSPEGKKIEVKMEKIKGNVLIEVSDHGVGIKSQDIPHIFDRFYQSDQSRSRNNDGFGLGLAIAKRIVELHHGTINVESKVRKGTKFSIKIPAK